MLDENYSDKLKKIQNLLEINFERLDYAYSRTEFLLPFSTSRIQNLEAEQISFIDQYIFRFSKIQDIMGEKLFRMILEAVAALNSLFNSKKKLMDFYKSCIDYLKKRKIF